MFTILFPTDFSAPADQALQYAVALAEKIAAKVVLFHAVPVPLQDPNTFFKPAEIYSRDESQAKLEALRAQVATRIPCDAVLKVGYSVTELTDFMEANFVDMVLIGTRGAGDTPDTLVGSTTAGLIGNSKRPVLVIPAGAAFVPPDRIVLGADLRETNRTSLHPLIALARLFDSEILVVNVTSQAGELPVKKAVEALKLEDYLEEVPTSVHVVVDDQVTEAIEKFAVANNAQMLAVVARKHGFLASLFHDSITRKMTLHTGLPLLALVE
jgi:nucleotide-binding universal stress UspA family protein